MPSSTSSSSQRSAQPVVEASAAGAAASRALEDSRQVPTPSGLESLRRRGLGPLLTCLVGTAVLLVPWRLSLAQRLPPGPTAKDHIIGEIYRPPTENPYYAYRNPALADLLIIGSSRVDQGIVESELEARGLGTTVVFTGPGAQLLELLRWTRTFAPRRLVVSLDPLTFYSEQHPDLPQKFALEEEHGGTFEPTGTFRQRADQWASYGLRRVREGLARPIEADLLNAFLYPELKPDASNEPFKRRLVPRTRPQRRQNAIAAGKVMRDMLQEGWDIVCIRIPLSSSLLQIENKNFQPAFYEEVCELAGVPFLDYSRESFETFDGAHLTLQEARRFSRRLAHDLVREHSW